MVNHGSSQSLLSASVRITEADAKAVLRTFGSDPEFRVTLLPFSDTPTDGRHYCSLDWHVAVFTYVHDGDASFTRKDAITSLNAVSVSLVLNGVAITTERTKIKRHPDPLGQFVVAYYFREGHILAPTDLAVGQHTLAVSITDPRLGDLTSQSTFFLDAPGTGTCL